MEHLYQPKESLGEKRGKTHELHLLIQPAKRRVWSSESTFFCECNSQE